MRCTAPTCLLLIRIFGVLAASTLPSLTWLSPVACHAQQVEQEEEMLFQPAARLPVLEAFREETKVRQVTSLKAEERTRTVVDNATGKQFEQTYTVMVPFTEEREVTMRTPAGRKPKAVLMEECRFYTLNNESLDASDVEQRLAKLTTVLLLDGIQGEPMPLDPLALELLRADCLIVATQQLVRTVPPPMFFPAQGPVALPAPALLPAVVQPALPVAPKP